MREHTRRLAVLLVAVLVVIGAPVAVHNFGDSGLDTEGYSPIGLAQAVAWNISDAEHIQDTDVDTANDPREVEWGDSGNKVYLGNSGGDVLEYDVSTAYNTSSMTLNNTFTPSGQTDNAQSLYLSSDGTVLYVLDGLGSAVHQYSLSTAWNVSTASYTGNSFDTSGQDTEPRGLTFDDDRSHMYVTGAPSDAVHEYTISNGNVSTASLVSSTDVSSQDGTMTSIEWGDNGQRMYLLGNGNDNIYEYSVTTAYDSSTITHERTKNVSAETFSPEGLDFKPDGTKMYMASNVNEAGNLDDEVVSYRLADASTGGGGATATPTPDGYYVQPIGLISRDEEFFNPQLSDIKAYVYVDDNGTRLSKITGDGEWAPETSDQFHSPNNFAFLNLVDGKVYKFVVEDHLGNVVHRVGWVADRHPDGCVVDCSAYVIVVRGPTGGGEAGGDGETDGSGTFTTAPDLNQTDYKLPDQEAYLQTGIFYFLDEGRCVGLRYWDPSYETTSISYNFTAQGTTYSGSIDTGSEVGYFEACLDPLGVEGGSELPDTGLEDLEGEIVFEGFQNGSAFGGAFGLNDFGSSLNESGGFFGPAGAGGGGGGEGNIPWWWWLGVVLLGYVFRDEIGENVKRISRGLGR